MAATNVDWTALAGQLGKEIPEAIKPILQPAAKEVGDDLRAYGVVIARDMVLAIKAGDEDWKDELLDQSKATIELMRIRAEPHAIEAAGVTLGVIFRVLRMGLKLGVGV